MQGRNSCSVHLGNIACFCKLMLQLTSRNQRVIVAEMRRFTMIGLPTLISLRQGGGRLSPGAWGQCMRLVIQKMRSLLGILEGKRRHSLCCGSINSCAMISTFLKGEGDISSSPSSCASRHFAKYWSTHQIQSLSTQRNALYNHQHFLK